MTHFSATPTVADSGDTIRLGSLEYPALLPVGMRVPLIFEPSQAFLFGSLNFVANRLSVLHPREETHDPAPIGETFPIDSRTCDLNGVASTLHSEQTLCSNPTVSNIHAVMYSLFSIFHRLPSRTPLSLMQPPYGQFPYGLASSADAYAQGLQRMLAPPPLASEFMGMASYAPTCFFDLMDDDGKSDGSSIGDMAPSHRPS